MTGRTTNGQKIVSEIAGSRYLDAGPRHHWEADVGPVRVFFGEGRLNDLGRIADRLGARRALVVTDPGISSAGHLELARSALASHSIDSEVFDRVTENPNATLVDEAARQVAELDPNLIVGLGGGSAMDCAKGINIVLTNGGSIADYWGYGRSHKPMLPSIGVPTTAGTGSEAQSFALISDSDTGRKMACGDQQARFRSVILDPALLASAPPKVAAAASMDALGHAVESLVSTRSNPISKTWSLRAFELLQAELKATVDQRSDALDPGNSLLGAHLAGAAIEQSMLGAAHACANPLTATYGIVHGEAIAILLPQVVRFNSGVVADQYQMLNALADLDSGDDAGETLARFLTRGVQALGMPTSLRELGVSKGDLESLAESATVEWTARFNPRPVSQAELLEIYDAAY